MAVTYSQRIELGTQAPDFDLPVAHPGLGPQDGDTRSLDDFSDAEVLVVVFMCNHCPYVKHVEDVLIETARAYRSQGVQFVGICSNDPEQYPEDAFDRLAARAKEKAYPFPYLYDAEQDVARRYGARCTPDVFIYDGDRRLVYHGRIDESRPGRGAADGHELRRALDDILSRGEVTFEQQPAMGCNIKWKSGNGAAG